MLHVVDTLALMERMLGLGQEEAPVLGFAAEQLLAAAEAVSVYLGFALVIEVPATSFEERRQQDYVQTWSGS